MIRRILALVRTWRVRNELYDDQPERHPGLAQVKVNEIIPFKGTHWKVASIHERPIPAIILTPQGETRASKLAHLRRLRRADRIFSKAEDAGRRALEKRAGR